MKNKSSFTACAVAAMALVAVSQPARAASTTSFNGLILDSCTLNLGTAGTLGLTDEGATLSSTAPGGIAATALIISTSAAYKLEVDPPSTFAQAPSGGQPDTTSVRYSATGVSVGGNIQAGSPLNLGLGITQVTMNTEAKKTSGIFPAGLYRMDVVMRCAPR